MFKTLFLIIAIIGSVVSTTIPTGFVGLSSFFGKYNENLLKPGFHLNFISEISLIEVRPQSDEVKMVECISKEGLPLFFEQIEVGNQLEEKYVFDVISKYGTNYDKYLVTNLVRHQINVICSSLSYQDIWIDKFNDLDDQLKEFIQNENNKLYTGLRINFVRLSKPVVPGSISEKHLDLANQFIIKKIIAEESTSNQLRKENEILLEKKKIELKLLELNAEAKNTEIQNQISISKAIADNKKNELEVQNMANLFKIPGYAEFKYASEMAKNTKVFYGTEIPKYIVPGQATNEQL